jgi:hypothetical protein
MLSSAQVHKKAGDDRITQLSMCLVQAMSIAITAKLTIQQVCGYTYRAQQQ